MTVGDYLVSVIRTVVPYAVGTGLVWLADKTGLTIPDEPAKTIVTGLVAAGYYAAVRALEARWPFFGVLLGYKAAPEYGWTQPAKRA